MPPETPKRKPRKRNSRPRGGGGRAGGSKKRSIQSLRDLLTRRYAWLFWSLGFLWWLGLLLYPGSHASTRFSSLVFFALLVTGLLALWWRYRALRWSLLGLILFCAGFLMLPGYDWYDRGALRQEIGYAMRSYAGVRYHPGGENRLGIGGIGLIRRGTIEGTFRHGISTLNPLLVRKAFFFWWHDVDAPSLMRGAGRQARRFTRVQNLYGFDHALLYPGDMAVSADGKLVLGYLGRGEWIEASAKEGRTLILRSDQVDHPALQTPATILRWRFLEARR